MGSGPELLVQGGVSLPNANPYSRVLREGEPTAAASAVWSQGKSSRELSGRWGPVFTVWLGQRPVVVLCRYAVLRDALVLQADAFSGRGAMAVFERFTRGNGAPFDPQRLLDNAVSNVCTVVLGNHYGYEDMEFLRLLDLFNDNFRIMSSRWGEEQKTPRAISRQRRW
ncbi:cytochrome P450 2F2 [Bubalus bubalis]|uniref:cytochrome P450 2F2 n=1 Tax=Bubalus bubalis TaxID=89462 RepID=UPI001E1B8629|nr:cytochrome P450 2F2 [Bubalus bubalis]